MRRYLYVIASLVAIAIIAVVAFLIWRSRSATVILGGISGSLPGTEIQSGGTSAAGGTQGTSQGGQGGAGATSQASGKFGIISNEATLNYFVDASNTVTTVQPDGKIEQIANGKSLYLSSLEINKVISADFSYDGKKILVSFGSQLSPQWSVFDIATKSWGPLSVSPMVAAWSPTNYQIAYLAGASGASILESLEAPNPKAKPKLLASFPRTDFEIAWLSQNAILLSDRSSALFSGSIFSFNLKTGVFSTVVQSRVGLEVRWSASGTMGLVLAGTALGRGGTLGIIDGAGTLLHKIAFLTLPSKCVFVPSSTIVSLLCGIPRNASALSNNQLPDAYDEMRIMTSDDIYRVSLANGDIASIFNDPAQNLDVSNIKLFNNTLFFINRYDQKLYALSLGQ